MLASSCCCSPASHPPAPFFIFFFVLFFLLLFLIAVCGAVIGLSIATYRSHLTLTVRYPSGKEIKKQRRGGSLDPSYLPRGRLNKCVSYTVFRILVIPFSIHHQLLNRFQSCPKLSLPSSTCVCPASPWVLNSQYSCFHFFVSDLPSI